MEFENNRVLVFGAQIIAVLIAMIGVVGQRSEFQSLRPAGPQTQPTGLLDNKSDRFARLWDDPLEHLPSFSVDSQISAWDFFNPLAENGTDQSSSESQTKPKKRLVILFPISAEPLPDIQEMRRRSRYAVASALSAAGFLPANPFLSGGILGHSTEFLNELPVDPDTGEPGKLPIDSVHEHFILIEEGRQTPWPKAKEDPCPKAQEDGGYDEVILFWCPLDRLKLGDLTPSALRKNIVDLLERDNAHLSGKSGWSEKLTIEIFHMGSSDDLIASRKHEDWNQPEQMNVHFLRATMSENLLQERLKNGFWSDTPDPTGSPINLGNERAVMTDDHLVKALVNELRLRIPALHAVNPKKPPKIVIFTESDTTYSAAIVKEMETQLRSVAHLNGNGSPPVLEVMTYLRGLDGRRDEPGRSSAPNEKREAELSEALRPGKSLQEATDGTSQFDYLRMRARSLAKEKHGAIVAVGVMGSDVFDKLLVLQAVRPELPSAHFFTTDLYAAFFQAGVIDSTRNLIVASAHGLEVDPAQNVDPATPTWRLPPMRDTYQTALVEQTWKSLNGDNTAIDTNPHVFEIAAGRAFDLTEDSRTPNELIMTRVANRGWNILIFYLTLLVGLGVVGSAMATVPSNGENSKPSLEPWAHRVIHLLSIVFGAFFVSLVLGYVFLYAFPKYAPILFGEPFTLIAGVSVWPSIIIRLFAFVIGIQLLRRASLAATAELHHARAKFSRLMPADFSVNTPGTVPKLITNLFHWLTPRHLHPLHSEVKIESMLDYLGDRGRRFVRIVALSLAYFIISGILFGLWPPVVPARGDTIFFIEKTALALSVALYIVHLFYCVDLHLSALLLIQALNNHFRYPKNGEVFDSATALKEIGVFTRVVGKTLLYPLTILILLIIARFEIFDNWSTPPSLKMTYSFAALILIYLSSRLMIEARTLRDLARESAGKTWAPLRARMLKGLDDLDEGSFGPWYKQPIFVALISFVGVFGSIGVAPALVGLFF